MSEIAVLGAGIMGHGIALVFALGGHQVRLTDSRAETLEKAPGLMEAALETLREAGEADASWTAERLRDAIRCSASPAETVRGAEVVIEAITELPDAKRALFAEIDPLLGDDTILASNTSYLDVFPLIPARRQRQALIAHWYTPPYLVDLVDIVPGPETDPAFVERMRALIEGIGQVPIVLKKFISGYIANRIQSAITLGGVQAPRRGLRHGAGDRRRHHPRAGASHPDPRAPRQGRLHRHRARQERARATAPTTRRFRPAGPRASTGSSARAAPA